MRNAPSCCGEVVWVDNIPGKEYHYCRGCKLEVLASVSTAAEPKFGASSVYKQLMDRYINFQGALPMGGIAPPSTGPIMPQFTTTRGVVFKYTGVGHLRPGALDDCVECGHDAIDIGRAASVLKTEFTCPGRPKP